MEAEKRPTKVRKLERSLLDGEHVVVEYEGSNELIAQCVTVNAHQEEAYHLEPAGADAIESNEPVTNCSKCFTSDDDAELGPPDKQFTFAPPLSKNALKKLRNKEKWDAGRDARKLKRKQKIAEKRIRKRAEKEGEEAQAAAAAKAEQKEANCKDKPTNPSHTRLPITVVIDCGFDSLMTEREMISLGSQLTRCYSDNHKAPYQVHIIVSSWGGQLKERFDTVLEKHHENWRGVMFMEEDFVEAAERAKGLMKGKRGGKLAGAFTAEENDKMWTANGSELVPQQVSQGDKDISAGNTTALESQPAAVAPEKEEHMIAGNLAPVAKDEAPLENGVARGSKFSANGDAGCSKIADANETVRIPETGVQHEGEVVYLTSDSPHTLHRLQPYSTYIIGGLVDKNRHKGICYKTACSRGIKTAKLPIGDFMEMQSRFVLATNHVVEIMVRWLECGDWGKSFMRVMPKRKGGVLKAASGLKHDVDVHGVELEGEDDTSGSGDSGEAKAHLEGGDIPETHQNTSSTPSMS